MEVCKMYVWLKGIQYPNPVQTNQCGGKVTSDYTVTDYHIVYIIMKWQHC